LTGGFERSSSTILAGRRPGTPLLQTLHEYMSPQTSQPVAVKVYVWRRERERERQIDGQTYRETETESYVDFSKQTFQQAPAVFLHKNSAFKAYYKFGLI